MIRLTDFFVGFTTEVFAGLSDIDVFFGERRVGNEVVGAVETTEVVNAVGPTVVGTVFHNMDVAMFFRF